MTRRIPRPPRLAARKCGRHLAGTSSTRRGYRRRGSPRAVDHDQVAALAFELLQRPHPPIGGLQGEGHHPLAVLMAAKRATTSGVSTRWSSSGAPVLAILPGRPVSGDSRRGRRRRSGRRTGETLPGTSPTSPRRDNTEHLGRLRIIHLDGPLTTTTRARPQARRPTRRFPSAAGGVGQVAHRVEVLPRGAE